MDFLQIIKWIAGLGTLLTGLISLVAPLKVRGFTGLEVQGGRGITEIRAVLGGAFLALGGAALYFNNDATYLLLGIVYLVIGAVRAVSMFVDKSVVKSNVISLAVEIVFGILLVL